MLLLTLSARKMLMHPLHVSVNPLHRFAAGNGAAQHSKPISFEYHREKQHPNKIRLSFYMRTFCVLWLQDLLNRTN